MPKIEFLNLKIWATSKQSVIEIGIQSHDELIINNNNMGNISDELLISAMIN